MSNLVKQVIQYIWEFREFSIPTVYMHSMCVDIMELRLSLIIVYLSFSVIIRSFNTSNQKLTSRTSICRVRNDINNFVYLFRHVGQKFMSRFFVNFELQYSQWRETGSSLTRWCSTKRSNFDGSEVAPRLIKQSMQLDFPLIWSNTLMV